MNGERPSHLPVIILTGASGFVGRHFLNAYKEQFFFYAIARRSQKIAGIKQHPNIEWIRLDIFYEDRVKEVFKKIQSQGGADYVFHFAGYYDFGNEPIRAYTETNVEGTRHILEACRELQIKRFIFSSSLTVTAFDKPGCVINEKSPCDASFPYAVSKRKAEALIRNHSAYFPCTIVRFAAVFSDWCEYGPLYIFLSTWLSHSWNSSILGGKGESAVPYIHIRNLTSFLKRIIEKHDVLPALNTFIASPDGCSTHKELFRVACRYDLGQEIKPSYMPRYLAFIGVAIMDLFGRFIGNRPFERTWMIRYIDKKLDVDASWTRRQLDWEPTKRYAVTRRLLFLIENMKRSQKEWTRRNQEALTKRYNHPKLMIYEFMNEHKGEIADESMSQLTSNAELKTYQQLEPEKLKHRIQFIIHMIMVAIRTGDRIHVLTYANNLAKERYTEKFSAVEVITAVTLIADIIVASLLKQPNLEDKEQWIYDEITMTSQLIIDEIEDTYDELVHGDQNLTSGSQ